MVCSFFSWQYWSLLLWECGGAYSNCEYRAVQSHAGNISAHWVTSLSTRFAVVPTRWNNCSHSRNFNANPRGSVSGQTHFSFWANHLAHLLTWPCSTSLCPLWLRQKQGIWNTSCQYCWLKTKFWSVFKVSPRKCYNVLWQPFHRNCRSVLNDMVVTYGVSYSNNNDWDEFSWTWNAPDSVNNIFPLCLKKLFHLKNHQVFWHTLYYVKICMSFCTHGHIHLSPVSAHSHP